MVLNLTHHFLISTETDTESIFYKAIVYVCDHTEQGSLGIIINRLKSIKLMDIFDSLDIVPCDNNTVNFPIYEGGPVHQHTGFVLHKNHVLYQGSTTITDDIAITTSKDVVVSLAQGDGPNDLLFALGCSGWDAGQLEQELVNHCWLTVPATADILFNTAIQYRWTKTIELLGIDPAQLIMSGGHA